MDPDDLPTTLDINSAHTAETVDKFKEMLWDEIECDHTYDFPLSRFCYDGGSGDDLELDEIEVASFTPKKVTGKIRFFFTEAYIAGCRDMEWRQRYYGYINFELDRGDQTIDLSGGSADKTGDDPSLGLRD